MCRGVKKIIALSVIFVFTVTQSSWGLNAGAIEVRPALETPSFLQIEIPEELAIVEDVYEAPPKLDPRLVLHVQNAHGNYEAQVKIKKILEHLSQNYGFQLLFVEGASNEMDASQINFFEEQQKNIEVVDYLAKKGQATGADLFLIEAGDPIKAVGIENAGLYRGNYAAFREVYSQENNIENYLEVFDSKMNLLSSRFLNSDMRKLISEWQKFESGHREFLPYVNLLKKEAKKILGLDLDSLFAQVEWPQMTRLLAIQAMESDIDQEAALREKDELLQFLKGKGISESIISGIQKLEDKKININKLNKKEDAIEHMPRHLLERLVEEAGPKGFAFHRYPAFSLYAGYVILSSELESKPLFTEIERLFKKILDELAVNEEEKDLLELFRDGELLRKLLYLELNSKEWARAFYRKDWIQPQTLLSRLEGVGERFYQDELKVVLNEQIISDQIFESVHNAFQYAFSFYEYARKREVAFYSKIKSTMAKNKQDKAILISGGFHSEGLMDLFKEDEVNYGVLSPRIQSTEGRDSYLSVMMGKQQSMFDISNIEIISLLQNIDARKNLGANPVNDLLSLLEAYLSVAQFENLEAARDAIEFFNLNSRDISLRVAGDDDDPEIAIELNVSEQFQTLRTQDGNRVIVRLTRSPEGYWIPADLASTGDAVGSGINVNLRYASVGPRGLTPQEVIETEGIELALPSNPEVNTVEDTSIRRAITELTTENSEVVLPPEVSLDQVQQSNVAPSVQVAILTGNIGGYESLQGVREVLVLMANYFKSLLAPRSNMAITFADFFNEDPAIVTYVLSEELMGPISNQMLEDMLGLLRENPFTVLNLVVPVKGDISEIQDGLDNQVAALNRNGEFDNVVRRLNIKVLYESPVLAGNVGKLVQSGAAVLRSTLRDAGIQAVPGVVELADSYSTVLTPDVYDYVGDLILGNYLKGINIRGDDAFIGQITLAVLLSKYKTQPEKLNDLTVSALKRQYYDDQSWFITDNFSMFMDDVLNDVLTALRSETRAAISA